MKKIVALIVLLLFILCKERVIVNALLALEFWSKQLFPLLFPTFILSDFLLSTGIVNWIQKKFGSYYEKLFKTNRFGLFVFLISMLVGSPTNAKILQSLKEEGLVDDNDISKILAHSIMFNPFLVLSFGGLKLLLSIWVANFLVGLIFRNAYSSKNTLYKEYTFQFNLLSSINKNLDIIFNILGVVVLFSAIIAFIPDINVYFKVVLIAILEVTNTLNFINSFLDNMIFFYAIAFSLGGLSILMQIKSILVDTSLNYKLLICSRLIVACITEAALCYFTTITV